MFSAVTAIPWPDGPHTHEWQQMGYLLGNVVVGEWLLHDRPLLSAVVVLAGDRVPGRGFDNVAEDLGLLPIRNAETELIFLARAGALPRLLAHCPIALRFPGARLSHALAAEAVLSLRSFSVFPSACRFHSVSPFADRPRRTAAAAEGDVNS